MNTPEQQAELYRKAAETIEMCAEHGIDAKVKVKGNIFLIFGFGFTNPFDCYEFPIAVIEGQLVWKGDKLQEKNGICAQIWIANEKNSAGNIVCISEKEKYPCRFIDSELMRYVEKKPLCEVEGKPVYKGDKLWNIRKGNTYEFIADSADVYGVYDLTGRGASINVCSFYPPKRTVMVELSIEDAEHIAKSACYGRVTEACCKVLEGFKS